MKHMKPIKLALRESLPDGYRLMAVADQWSELLPEKVPLRYAIFRYLGFYVVQTKNGKTSVLKGKQLGSITVTIQNEEKTIFSETIRTAFRNGVYYVQDIRLTHAGVHRVNVVVNGKLSKQVDPLVLSTQVYEFMELDDCPDWTLGVYAPLRTMAHTLLADGEQEKLRDDEFIESCVHAKTHSLRAMDARWWLRAFVEHALDREVREKILLQKSAKQACRTTHKRKQDHPSRTADKREHDHLFERRRREWKRLRNGEMRMFTTEPLHAEATVTLYSKNEMYRQLSLYAQV